MSIWDERRAEPRTELHRLWTVSVEFDRLGQRRAQVLDYSASGIKLAFDGVSDLRPGAPLEITTPARVGRIEQRSPGQRKMTQRPSLVLGS